MAIYGKNKYPPSAASASGRGPSAEPYNVQQAPLRNDPVGSVKPGDGSGYVDYGLGSPDARLGPPPQGGVDVFSGLGGYQAEHLGDSPMADAGVTGPTPEESGPFSGEFGDDWQAFLDQLGGLLNPRDTSAQEAQIMDTYRGDLGSGMNALAAQMGAAGFGQSGALLEAGSDLQGQLARQATGQIEDVRRGAHQDYMQQMGLVGQMLMGGEAQGLSSEYYGNLMQAIIDSLGGGSDAEPGGPDTAVGQAGQAATDAFEYATGSPNPGGLLPETWQDALFGGKMGDEQWVGSSDELPEGAERYGSSSDVFGMFDIYRVTNEDGTVSFYNVPRGQ